MANTPPKKKNYVLYELDPKFSRFRVWVNGRQNNSITRGKSLSWLQALRVELNYARHNLNYSIFHSLYLYLRYFVLTVILYFELWLVYPTGLLGHILITERAEPCQKIKDFFSPWLRARFTIYTKIFVAINMFLAFVFAVCFFVITYKLPTTPQQYYVLPWFKAFDSLYEFVQSSGWLVRTAETIHGPLIWLGQILLLLGIWLGINLTMNLSLRVNVFLANSFVSFKNYLVRKIEEPIYTIRRNRYRNIKS